MYSLKRTYIRRLFTDPWPLLQEGIYFSAHTGEGEYMSWHPNGQLWIQSFFEAGKQHGHYREWDASGSQVMHLLFRKGKRVRILE
jgi:antitoxin component YwqK of YwqJK toxin-antitoxin module